MLTWVLGCFTLQLVHLKTEVPGKCSGYPCIVILPLWDPLILCLNIMFSTQWETTALLWQSAHSVLNKHGQQIHFDGNGLHTPAKCVTQQFDDVAEQQQSTRHTSYCMTWLKFVFVFNSPSWNVSTGTWSTAVNFRNILYMPSQSQTTSHNEADMLLAFTDTSANLTAYSTLLFNKHPSCICCIFPHLGLLKKSLISVQIVYRIRNI
jgi:hypothetical protein